MTSSPKIGLWAWFAVSIQASARERMRVRVALARTQAADLGERDDADSDQAPLRAGLVLRAASRRVVEQLERSIQRNLVIATSQSQS